MVTSKPRVFLGLVLALGLAVVPAAQAPAPSQAPSTAAAPPPARPQSFVLPPISYTCPMHREVLESGPGTCPICQMDLVATRVRTVWICPVHAAIAEPAAGTCRICRRDLVQATMEVAWTCPMHPDVRALEPGKCPVCEMDLVEQFSARPHEDHNPKHGGIFFMAPDNWHHLEGTYPEPGVFRVYLYDNYSQPLDAKGVTGRAVTGEGRDPATGETRELVPSADGRSLEASVGSLSLPAEIMAKIAFKPGASEDRFDFIFADHSREAAAPAAPAAAPAAPPGPGEGGGPLFQGAVTPIPDRPGDIAFEIRVRDLRIQYLMSKGAFTDVFIPALEAKDLALALDDRLDGLAPDRQRVVRLAVRRLVRAAWLLDWYGDLGNRQQVDEAYVLFGAAAEEIRAAYGVP